MRESPALIESRAFGVRHIPMLRPLAWLGRWPLLVYMLHQPLLIGALGALQALR